MRNRRIAVIAGDGIGMEVVTAAVPCVDAALSRHDAQFDWNYFDWGSDLFLKTGRMMPPDGLEILREYDAIFFGAVGSPGIPDTDTLWGLLIPIRREFQQYINLRPIRALPGVTSRVLDGDAMDLLIVRENNEGEYSEVGGRVFANQPEEFAVQESIFSRKGVSRVAAYAAERAVSRRGLLTSATKSNGILHTMPF